MEAQYFKLVYHVQRTKISETEFVPRCNQPRYERTSLSKRLDYLK